jgi:hypothetical protein
MTNPLQVQFGFVSTSATSGQVVAGQAGNNILVLQLFVIVSAGSVVQFQSSTGSTNVSAQVPLAANGGFVLPYSKVGWFQTLTPGDSLNFVQSFAALIGIQIVYCYI